MMHRLQDWAARRRAAGGAPIKVRVVKGANLAMERVEATLHGWPLATWSTKQETDTNYKRVLDWALTPERVDAVRIGVAGQNLFDIAWAWLLAGDRGVRDAVDFEMLLGMDTGPAAAVRADVGPLLLYTPVVHPDEFDVAIAYLVRRLEENASSENFMSAAFELSVDPALLRRETERFLESVKHLDRQVPTPHRDQDRLTEPPVPAARPVHQHRRHRPVDPGQPRVGPAGARPLDLHPGRRRDRPGRSSHRRGERSRRSSRTPALPRRPGRPVARQARAAILQQAASRAGRAAG